MTSLADMASRGEAEAPHARATAAQLQDSLKVVQHAHLLPFKTVFDKKKWMQQLINHNLVKIGIYLNNRIFIL